MRYLSLFSGIEAASVAWAPLGWEPVAFAEIEPFPCAVLAHHYPTVPNLKDVTRIDGTAFRGRVDLVVGGFPCQDLSVAGNRKGLLDDDGRATRSGLFYDALRIADDSGARWLVVENVPGLLSNRAGEDFAAVVGAMAGCQVSVPADGWDNTGILLGPKGMVEWCVLDAQFFGVPQRRRRVFLVRDSGDWASRPPVLFERACLQGNPPPSRKAGEKVAGTFTARARSGGWDQDPNLAAGGYMQPVETYVPDIVPQAMSSKGAKGSSGPAVDEVANLVAHTLRGDGFDASEDGTGRGTPLVPIAFSSKDHGADAGELAPTLRSMGHDKSHENGGGQVAVKQGMTVRRLTPQECARLQGFPDEYLDIPYRGKPACDGPKYKALGNSMAVPVMAWIGRRIEAVQALP